ncbi:mannose-1-phosphate guanylyltransferase/mannose-6-phosphate isomerase [Hydrogenovibrio halophilus]|uniref:mannose-1-phosphate guanylyltransferase/mannose-6-phosphate isomerase n=1 Tax=Hydrogenovibrio halophilus TaxID=373391 RepID=UPI0003630A97|nr:mannose-1-phosphate guanylyltransferase/mannose-6-phosphate isomerase [Hydrogenovibrio halophilus]
MITNLILCGGSGTRLWPLSRKHLPKQFVKLFDQKSLFQKTIARNHTLVDEFIIMTNEAHYFIIKDQLEEIGITDARFILEPVGRNTAPAIALAAMSLSPEDRMFVTPSDHLIEDPEAYQQAVEQALSVADTPQMVTFGIRPHAAETGFGYIEHDGQTVLSFKEKPDQVTAQSYLDSGHYLWNSGMFCFQVNHVLDQLQQHAPDIHSACQKALKTAKTDANGLVRIDLEAMQAIPDESIDYALMEKSDQIAVIPADMDWSDMGSFDSLYEEIDKDDQGNAVLERGQNTFPSLNFNSRNNLIISRNHTIATVDVDDLIIVDTTDALLITKRGHSQNVKQVVAELKRHNSELTELHQLVYRPWGSYETLMSTSEYKLKRIIVHPGKKLSLQKHLHRSEHWVVVSGTAHVQVGEQIQMLRSNESTYIPIGEKHRLANHGKVDLVVMEVQVGEYTGEDDIIRYDDDFGR